MRPWLSDDSPQKACLALQRLTAARQCLSKTNARPWNPGDPSSPWWLVSATEGATGPTYRLGKIVVEFGGAPDSLNVALYVERGLGQRAATALDEPRLVMTNDWMWHRFLQDLRSGGILRTARNIGKAAQLDVYLEFLLGSPLSPSAPRAGVSFPVQRSPLTPDLGPRTSKLLRPFRAVTSDRELAAVLEKEVDGYTWIDAYVRAMFACTPGARTENVWTADRLWSELVAPLSPWIG